MRVVARKILRIEKLANLAQRRKQFAQKRNKKSRQGITLPQEIHQRTADQLKRTG